MRKILERHGAEVQSNIADRKKMRKDLDSKAIKHLALSFLQKSILGWKTKKVTHKKRYQTEKEALKKAGPKENKKLKL